MFAKGRQSIQAPSSVAKGNIHECLQVLTGERQPAKEGLMTYTYNLYQDNQAKRQKPLIWKSEAEAGLEADQAVFKKIVKGRNQVDAELEVLVKIADIQFQGHV